MQGFIPLLRQTGGFGLVEVGSVDVWRGERTALSRPAAFSVSMPTGSKGFLCAGTHGAQRRVPVIPVRAHHAPEALQRRVSLMLVMRTQVQPVSLQTRSSPAPGALRAHFFNPCTAQKVT